jgi:hypothetical protein
MYVPITESTSCIHVCLTSSLSEVITLTRNFSSPIMYNVIVSNLPSTSWDKALAAIRRPARLYSFLSASKNHPMPSLYRM